MSEDEPITEVHGFRCNFCGEILPTKEAAQKCWELHSFLVNDYVFQLGEEFPTEVLVEKVLGGFIEEVASYELVKKEKIHVVYKPRSDS
jgi:hypothetical protein